MIAAAPVSDVDCSPGMVGAVHAGQECARLVADSAVSTSQGLAVEPTV